jgi:hypothetical protein
MLLIKTFAMLGLCLSASANIKSASVLMQDTTKTVADKRIETALRNAGMPLYGVSGDNTSLVTEIIINDTTVAPEEAESRLKRIDPKQILSIGTSYDKGGIRLYIYLKEEKVKDVK